MFDMLTSLVVLGDVTLLDVGDGGSLAAAKLGADVDVGGELHVADGKGHGTLLGLGGEGDDLGSDGRDGEDERALHFDEGLCV